jgi:RNA polymerase sigma-70 factor (ECF subfamily)
MTDVTQRSDLELLQACAAQDRAAFKQLYARWGGRLHGVALRITRDQALAADAVHDAFVQVWQQAGRYDSTRGEPGSWLVSLARYRALDMVRRRGREELGHEPMDQPDEAPDPLANLLASADGGALHRCLQKLEEQRRRIVVMAFVEGYSHAQLAERLAMPVGTIKSWIRRSLIGLKECLAP